MKAKKITIFDVAERAGVSKGTVDRVLHNRGEVSQKSEAKVRKAIAELQYEPNLYASLLATRKNRLIACLLPEAMEGEYWEKVRDGFIQGAKEAESLNLVGKVFSYDQYDLDSFEKACNELLEASPEGVVLAPLFKNRTEKLIADLKSRKIAYVFVDTKIDKSSYLAYYGMPMYESGYLCAALLTERLEKEEVKSIVTVRLIRGKSGQVDPTENRRKGFTDYIEEHFPECIIKTLFINPADSNCASALEGKVSDEDKLLVTFNSRIHLINDFLATHPCKGRRVIGFDNLDRNIEALKEGNVTLLITHHTEKQAQSAVSALANQIIVGKKPEKRDNHAHMDILTRLNLENYI